MTMILMMADPKVLDDREALVLDLTTENGALRAQLEEARSQRDQLERLVEDFKATQLQQISENQELRRKAVDLTRKVSVLGGDLVKLEQAVRKHRDMPGDGRCWTDDHDLYVLLPEGFPPQTQNQPEVMLESRRRFIAQRHEVGRDWETEQERIARAVQTERERCLACCKLMRYEGTSVGDVTDAIASGEPSPV